METDIKYLKPVFNVTRDISHLPWWKQWLFHQVFVRILRVGYWLQLPVMVAPNGARVDVQSIAETDAIARAICAAIGPSSFYIPQVPKNMTLPVAAVVFGGNRAPYSPAAALFEKMGREKDVSVVCPTSGNICRPHETLDLSRVEEVYREVKVLVEL